MCLGIRHFNDNLIIFKIYKIIIKTMPDFISSQRWCKFAGEQDFPIQNSYTDQVQDLGHSFSQYGTPSRWITYIYYMQESVLLGTKPLVDFIRHFIRDPSGVFSVCHLCECCIVQWRHESRLLLLLNWFLHIIKRTLHVGSKIWILWLSGKNNISRVSET